MFKLELYIDSNNYLFDFEIEFFSFDTTWPKLRRVPKRKTQCTWSGIIIRAKASTSCCKNGCHVLGGSLPLFSVAVRLLVQKVMKYLLR